MIDEGHRLVRGVPRAEPARPLPGPGRDQRGAHRRARRLDDRLVAGAGALRPAAGARPEPGRRPQPGGGRRRGRRAGGRAGPGRAARARRRTTPGTRPGPTCCAGSGGTTRRGRPTTGRSTLAGNERGACVPARRAGTRLPASPGRPWRSAMHIVRYSSVGRDPLQRPGSSWSRQHALFIIRTTTQSRARCSSSPACVDQGVEPPPHARRGRRAVELVEPVPQHRRRARSAGHRSSASGRSPARAHDRRPSRSRSAGRRGSGCRCWRVGHEVARRARPPARPAVAAAARCAGSAGQLVGPAVDVRR